MDLFTVRTTYHTVYPLIVTFNTVEHLRHKIVRAITYIIAVINTSPHQLLIFSALVL